MSLKFRIISRISIRSALGIVLTAMGAMLVLTHGFALFGDFGRSVESRRLVVSAVASRGLFQALANLRTERSVVTTLLNSPAIGSEQLRRTALAARAASETGFEMAINTLTSQNVPGLAELRTAHDAVMSMRTAADAAVVQGPSERGADTVRQWPVVSQKYLDVLSRVSDAFDGSFQTADPVIGYLLSIKQAAWAARSTNGGAVFLIFQAVGMGRPWTPAETQTAALETGKSFLAWDILSRAAARPDTPAALVAAIRRAATNFTGETADVWRSVSETLSQGRVPPLSATEVQDRSGRDQALIVDVANAAIDAMVLRAQNESSASARGLVIGGILLVFSSVLTVLGFLIVVRRVTRPLRAMTNAMQRLANRDMSIGIPGVGRSDEIGAMAGAVQIFKDNMIEVDRLAAEQATGNELRRKREQATEALIVGFDNAVAEILRTVASSASELDGTARDMAAIAEKTSREAVASATAADQTSANVQTVASATEEMSCSLQETARQVDRSTNIANDAVRQAAQTDVTVLGLSEAAQKIGEVVSLINDIASQTNLLALNATIEAARAGEHGKGFAVVATEVKNLAGQTGKATEEISAQIAAIQAATGGAVGAIRGIGDTIRQMNEITTAISAAVEEQNAATTEISRNITQAAAGTQEVSRNVGQVRQASGQTSAAATQVLGAAGGLSRQAERLRVEVERFLAGIRTAS